MMRRAKMEILIFALIASYNARRHQEWVIAKPQEFQPFDLQALRNSARTTSQSRSSSRQEAYVPQNRLTSSTMDSLALCIEVIIADIFPRSSNEITRIMRVT